MASCRGHWLFERHLTGYLLKYKKLHFERHKSKSTIRQNRYCYYLSDAFFYIVRTRSNGYLLSLIAFWNLFKCSVNPQPRVKLFSRARIIQ